MTGGGGVGTDSGIGNTGGHFGGSNADGRRSCRSAGRLWFRSGSTSGSTYGRPGWRSVWTRCQHSNHRAPCGQ